MPRLDFFSALQAFNSWRLCASGLLLTVAACSVQSKQPLNCVGADEPARTEERSDSHCSAQQCSRRTWVVGVGGGGARAAAARGRRIAAGGEAHEVACVAEVGGDVVPEALGQVDVPGAVRQLLEPAVQRPQHCAAQTAPLTIHRHPCG